MKKRGGVDVTEWDGRSYTERMHLKLSEVGTDETLQHDTAPERRKKNPEHKAEGNAYDVPEQLRPKAERRLRKKRHVRWLRVFLYLLLLAIIAVGAGVYLAIWFMGDLYSDIDARSGVKMEVTPIEEILQNVPAQLQNLAQDLFR